MSRATQVWCAIAKRPYPFHCHLSSNVNPCKLVTFLDQNLQQKRLFYSREIRPRGTCSIPHLLRHPQFKQCLSTYRLSRCSYAIWERARFKMTFQHHPTLVRKHGIEFMAVLVLLSETGKQISYPNFISPVNKQIHWNLWQVPKDPLHEEDWCGFSQFTTHVQSSAFPKTHCRPTTLLVTVLCKYSADERIHFIPCKNKKVCLKWVRK